MALGWEPERKEAPRVLAAGEGHLARKIMEIAREAGVHIHRDDTLARLLARVPVGMEIPEEAWQVVAELLAFLYREDRRLEEKTARFTRQDLPPSGRDGEANA
ncbi:MAG: EscU/YscU/HrcU family type III secretion system export apparatus switch protein [Mariprofundaceae bacterium]